MGKHIQVKPGVKRVGFVIRAQELKGDLKPTPDQQGIKDVIGTAVDVSAKPLSAQAARQKDPGYNKEQGHPEAVEKHADIGKPGPVAKIYTQTGQNQEAVPIPDEEDADAFVIVYPTITLFLEDKVSVEHDCSIRDKQPLIYNN
jgi:hypothetical protein